MASTREKDGGKPGRRVCLRPAPAPAPAPPPAPDAPIPKRIFGQARLLAFFPCPHRIPSADQGTSDPEPEHKTAWGLNCREVAIQTFQLAIQTPAKLPLHVASEPLKIRSGILLP